MASSGMVLSDAIGGDEWDKIPDDELEETISERIWGLREMLPDGMRRKLEVSTEWGMWLASRTFAYGKGALWIISTSFIILFLPFVIEKERADFEKNQVAQQRQLLLGPSAAVNAAKR